MVFMFNEKSFSWLGLVGCDGLATRWRQHIANICSGYPAGDIDSPPPIVKLLNKAWLEGSPQDMPTIRMMLEADFCSISVRSDLPCSSFNLEYAG